MAEREPNFLSDPADITAQELRTAYAHLQEGVLGANDLKVSVGAGRSVDVAAGTLYVGGDDVTTVGQEQGLYLCANDATKNSDAFTGGGITAPAASPRVDQIIAQLLDTDYDGSGQRLWQLEVLTGTPAAGAQIATPGGANYRSGATMLPDSAALLADALVATDGTVTVVDRRRRAKGASSVKARASAADLNTASVSFVSISAADYQTRLECSGAPLDVEFVAPFYVAAGTDVVLLAVRVDGVVTTQWRVERGATHADFAIVRARITPTPGSHIFDIHWARNTAASVSLRTNDGQYNGFSLREDLRPDADNG